MITGLIGFLRAGTKPDSTDLTITPELNRRRRIEGWTLFGLFVFAVWFGNYMVENIGTRFQEPYGPWMIPVWPGVLNPFSGDTIWAPSGVAAAGAVFTLRDLVQRRLGVGFSITAILIGISVTLLIAPGLALASAVAFAVAELMDTFVYTPLQRKRLILAVLASNVVALVADTFLFLSIAFGSIALFEGQIIAKLQMTLIALPLVIFIRARDRERGMPNFATTIFKP